MPGGLQGSPNRGGDSPGPGSAPAHPARVLGPLAGMAEQIQTRICWGAAARPCCVPPMGLEGVRGDTGEVTAPLMQS